MTDDQETIAYSSSIERFASVNSLLLSAYSLPCLDFKYDKFIKQLQEVSFDLSNDTGGKFDVSL